MLKSGIEGLDERLGGLVPGRVHLLTGCPGSGKTAACLEFLNQGLEDGEPCVMLTVDDPDDLMAQAEYLGIALHEPLTSGRLVLLRYQLDFARKVGRLPTPERVLEELRRLIGEATPSRFVIDSVVPFLEGGPASGATLSAVVELLEEVGATAMLTLPGDPGSAFDRRLDPVVRRAAAILDLGVERHGVVEISVRKSRAPLSQTGPIRCRIQPGRGFVAAGEPTRRRADDAPAGDPRRVVVVDLASSLPGDLLELLRRRFDVSHHGDVPAAFSELARDTAGAVILGVRRDSLRDAMTLSRELRRAGSRAPIILLTSSALRSSDGARALRAGADDFLPATLRPDELLLRIEVALRRGRAGPGEPVDEGGAASTHEEAGAPLDGDDFRAAIRAHVERDALPFFTLLTLRPQDVADLQRLAALVHAHIRGDGGDLAGVFDDHVAVYLHSARRKDVAPFIDRLSGAWRTEGRGELLVEMAAWPADEARIESLIGAGAS